MLEMEEIVAVWVLIKKLKQKKKKRKKLWLHPITCDRLTSGAFWTLFEDLRRDGDQFFNYFQMSVESFDILFVHLKSFLEKENTNMRKSIPSKERLAVTLRYLASGCTLTDLYYEYRIGISTLSQIIPEVCEAIWKELKASCIPFSSTDDWLKIAHGFKQHANFPNCIGSIDGKYIRTSKSIECNSKQFDSIILIAVCDASYNFTFVDIEPYDKNSDAAIFENTEFKKNLTGNQLNIPQSCPLPGKSESTFPFVFVADEAFCLSTHVMRPYSSKTLSQQERVFNYRLSRAQRFVECSFGILSNKWKIFHRPLNVLINFAQSIVRACVILHNFVLKRDGFNEEDTFSYEGFEDIIQLQDLNAAKAPMQIRKKFADYFINDGNLPWQHDRI